MVAFAGGVKSRSQRIATLRRVRLLAGPVLLVAALGYVATVADGKTLASTWHALVDDPLGLLLALACYALAFGLRSQAWRLVLPSLPAGHAWAALHVSLLGNHVLPFRLGEPLRVTSVLRRTILSPRPVIASALTLRTGDVLAVLLLALVVAPAALRDRVGSWAWAAATVLGVLAIAGGLWMRRHRELLRLPGVRVAALTGLAWAFESAVLWEIARVAGLGLTVYEAVAVTAVTIAAQTVALTPGGFGTYEAAASAAMIALGADPAAAFAVALSTHAVKTVYALVVGGVALFVPAPTYWGRFRLPQGRPPRPEPEVVAPDAPVVVIIPAYNEQATIGGVIRRLPASIGGHQVRVLVVDDGSMDASAAIASAAGAHVVAQPHNLGLGAAVRRGLAEASALAPAAVVYLDADGEYFPEDSSAVAGPVLDGTADYVVGSRFSGDIRRMHPHRRLGNQLLTRWVRWTARARSITDGQSGFRAFSPAAAAAAEIVHDYNYAQVLTLDLLGKGYVYAEVPITYSFRESGTSFVRLGRYLRRVVPAVHRELNRPSQKVTSSEIDPVSL